MIEVTLIQAWKLWFSPEYHEQLQNALLWGHPIWWWARIGKIVQFIAALTILAEIIGAERIRKFGNSLHSKVTWQFYINNLSDIWNWVFFFFSKNPLAKEAAAQSGLDNLFLVTFVLLELIAIIAGVRVGRMYDSILIAIIAILGFLFIGGWLSFFIVICVKGAKLLTGLLIDILVLEPVAWLIERPYLDKLIKIVSAVLLLIGFHFDLLAS